MNKSRQIDDHNTQKTDMNRNKAGRVPAFGWGSSRTTVRTSENDDFANLENAVAGNGASDGRSGG